VLLFGIVMPDRHRFAWMVASALFAASVLNYMDRAALSVLMQQVRSELALTNAQYGIAVNAFLVAYSILYVAGGRMVDRVGCRIGVFVTLTIWSIASAAHAFVDGLVSLCVARALLGAGEGAFYPAAIRGTAEWFPEATRAKPIGLMLAGISVGTLLTPPVAAWIALEYGWRAAFLITGALGFLLLPVWMLIHRAIRRAYGKSDPAPAYAESRARMPSDFPLSLALRAPKYWFAVTARGLGDTAWYFYLFWLPGYFQAERGYDAAKMGKLLWIPFFCAGIGALVGGWASSELVRRGMAVSDARRTTLLAAAVLCVIGSLAFAPGPTAALVLVAVALFGHQVWSTNIHTAITEISPPQHAAVMYGISGAAGTLAGALCQPAIGRLVDLRGYTLGFVAAGLCYVFAVIALVFGVRRIEPIVQPVSLVSSV
jgi:ACS family hexuronate transporter-like MFS transporter